MIQITITGNTLDELKASAATSLAALFGAKPAEAAPLSASEQARLRADATVVPPKGDKAKPTAAEKKAAKEAAEKAAAEAEANEPPTDEDVLEENTADEGEALTHDDVKKLLIEVRTAYPTKATIISEIVKEHGKATKISEVDAKNLPAVAEKCRVLLKAAKK